jgi:hypothetical protein
MRKQIARNTVNYETDAHLRKDIVIKITPWTKLTYGSSYKYY